MLEPGERSDDFVHQKSTSSYEPVEDRRSILERGEETFCFFKVEDHMIRRPFRATVSGRPAGHRLSPPR